MSGDRVLVTGGNGFLGRFVCEELRRVGAHEIITPTHDELELCDPLAVKQAFCTAHPDVVIHLAAHVGGIGANKRYPGTFWRDNTMMGVNVLEGCRVAEVKRIVVVGTVCAYPKFTPIPFSEDDLWSGFPEETNAPYGVAKRSMATGLASYRREFGLCGAYLLPANLYGPGDNFDLESSHVIPAMVRKCEEARKNGLSEVCLWGSGNPSREFLYVQDCAEAIVLAGSMVDEPEPINLGTGSEVRIRDLAQMVAVAVGYDGSFVWDRSRPDGQPRRSLSTERARRILGWKARTTLAQGLQETVFWYRHHENQFSGNPSGTQRGPLHSHPARDILTTDER